MGAVPIKPHGIDVENHVALKGFAMVTNRAIPEFIRF